MSGEILFLAHRLPFPPNRGDKIRSHHILTALAALAPVHVASFVDNPDDWAHEGDLAAIAASYRLVSRSRPLIVAGCEALLRGEAVSIAAFGSAALANYVEDILRTRPISAIYVFSGQMGQYVPAGFSGRLVVDLVDVDSAKFESYAAGGSGLRAWIDAREGRLLQAEEQRLANASAVTLLVSEAEAELLRSRLRGPAREKVRALGNGIDTASFNPAAPMAEHPLDENPGPHLVFTGQMDYAPNVEAAMRVIRHILPESRREWPGARFHVVGRAPSKELLAHDGQGGVRIWGEVPDVRPFLAGADIAIAPLVLARGVQNKVLEAMAMACPVVLTPGAATGIGAQDGVHFRVGDSDAELTQCVRAMLEDPARARAMGTAARQFVVEQRGWAAMLADLPDIMGLPRPEKASRNAA
ncbi:TIGR03087 family PEP-CTERM/XrtA system glycosyltransferase [Altererythrobacter sp. CC-YST694]|uniref:TIGR03087 family PEP-CTERM/XrtA system glycosyltransferase n=1 Tax=Altererythrobacter sp. CC-YST694 TaxID=2755038 RepID=UPI001D0260AE|nr:TIGR03087 family PEP-CTERM/XrtA system glycosyltransferase [Altererythrobacter sp. CC-YST694]MCB5424620.1 TIGR03087 family PEP-CTERM/XrtA system glycosyltransferase [Altererythrobacter sp. CC-YST694]